MSNTPRSSSPQQNHLLAGLPRAEYERLLPHLELVPLPLGKVLYEVGGRLDHVYFPTTAVVALLYVMENGASAEIGVVGNDGILGIAVFMGGDTRPNLAVVQNEGHAYRLKGQLLKQEFSLGEALQHQLLRYTLALTTQMAQTAICNRHYPVDQQLCRWLLLSLDRLSSNELSMTQKLIAAILGVRSKEVTKATGKLQSEGLIHYSRGRITVLDRPGLEARGGGCYEADRKESRPTAPRRDRSEPSKRLSMTRVASLQ